MDNNNLVDINEFVTDLYFMQEQNGGYIKPFMKSKMTNCINATEYMCKKMKHIPNDKDLNFGFAKRVVDYYGALAKQDKFYELLDRAKFNKHKQSLPNYKLLDFFTTMVVCEYYIERKLLKTIDIYCFNEQYSKFKNNFKTIKNFYYKELVDWEFINSKEGE